MKKMKFIKSLVKISFDGFEDGHSEEKMVTHLYLGSWGAAVKVILLQGQA